MVLCDTNIFIEIYRGSVAVRTVLEKIGYENVIVSDVTCAELLYGAANKAELQKIRKDLGQYTGFTYRLVHIQNGGKFGRTILFIT